MATSGIVVLPPDSTGKKVDTVELTVGTNLVERQVVVLGDPTTPTGFAAVLASAPTGAEAGLVVRQVGSSTVSVANFPTGFSVTGSTVAVSNFPATQPVSVAALPLPAGAALDATLTGGAVRVGGTVAVSAAGLPLPAGAAADSTVAAVTSSLGTDGAAPPSVPGTGVRGWLRSIYDRLGNPLAVTGTFFQATQPVSVSNFPATQAVSGTVTVVDSVSLTIGGTVTVANPTTGTPDVSDRAGRLLGHVAVDSSPLPAGASTEATLALIKAKTDNLDVALSTRSATGATQPVSAAALTDGSQKSQVVSGTGVGLNIDATGNLAIQSGGAAGSAVPARALQVAGSDGTNLRPLKASAAGVLSVDSTTAGAAAEVTLGRRFGGSKLAYSALLTSTTTDITPTTGKTLRLLWVAFVPNSDNSTANLVQIGFVGGGAVYTGYALAHWERFDGPSPNTALRVTLANTQPVAVTVHYEEF
jgi:hypothetical protein